MINYIKGDLLAAPQKVILHGCNAFGAMGSGAAKLIRAKWPNVYEIYNLRYRTFGLELGDIIPVATYDDKIIVNCITQQNAGSDGKLYVDYDAIATCMEKVNNRAKDWDVIEIAMPMIGAGLGGGDWKKIEAIISNAAKNFTPVVYSID